jgi:tRNA nucleotidyltransferase (CCA-adding enzyme)
LQEDLFRRDFTINAMAVELVPARYGRLNDPYGGRVDLGGEMLRVLHEKSFIDDSTRIWRALRYEQRLDFSLEADTLRLLNRDLPMLDTISGDRIRHELELVLKEERPEKALRRAGELGVLARLQPALKGDGWLADRFAQARETMAPSRPSVEIYTALLACRLSGDQSEELVSKLRFRKSVAQTLRDTQAVKSNLQSLADAQLPPSQVYALLHGCATAALNAISFAADSPAVSQHIQTYLTRLRYMRPSLTGNDLQQMGIPPGPRMKQILSRLHEARLDGKVSSKQEEVELVRGWLG